MKWKSGLVKLGVALLVVWLFGVYAVFYWAQNPCQAASLWAVGGVGLDLLTALGLMLAGAALGRRIMVWWDLDDLSLADQVWLAPGLGLGGIGLSTLGLGLLGGWRRPVVYGLALLAGGLLSRDAVVLIGRMVRWRPGLNVGRGERWYLGLVLAVTVMMALAPPTSWDGLFYHLTGPALFLEQGRITWLDVNIPHLSFPSLAEMLFGVGLMLRGDVTAKLVHLAYGLLLAALVYRLSSRWQGKEASRWSLLLLAATPMVSTLAAWAYNDLTLAFYQLAALYAMLSWTQTKRRGWLWAGGALSGLALGVKYTAFLLPLIGMGYLIWVSRQRQRWRTVLAYGLMAAAVAAPWYVRNLAFTGNPVYPFLFGGPNWDAFRAAWYGRPGTGIGWHALRILALPVTATLGLRDVNYYDGRMGPLFLALAPLVIWAVARIWRQRDQAPRRQVLVLCGGFGAAHLLIWTLGVIQSRPLFQARLLLPSLVALVPLYSEALVHLPALDRPRFSLSRFVHLLVSVTLIFSSVDLILGDAGLLRFDPFGYLTGMERREDYLSRVLTPPGYYETMVRLHDFVPETGKVLFLWEPRSYYSSRPAQPDAILDNWSHLVYLHRDEDGVADHLKEEGFTHVLLNRRGLTFVLASLRSEVGESPLKMEDVTRLERFIAEHLTLVERIESYELFRMRE